VTERQLLLAAEVRLVQVMPFTEVMTRLPIPDCATATNSCAPEGPPYTTETYWLSAAEVRIVQVTPVGDVITRLFVPENDTATNS
jgi:hypothetical protein